MLLKSSGIICDRAEELKRHPANSLTRNKEEEQKTSVMLAGSVATKINVRKYELLHREKKKKKQCTQHQYCYICSVNNWKKMVSSFQYSGGVIKSPFFLTFKQKTKSKSLIIILFGTRCKFSISTKPTKYSQSTPMKNSGLY